MEAHKAKRLAARSEMINLAKVSIMFSLLVSLSGPRVYCVSC
jgi:hypothetical protein